MCETSKQLFKHKESGRIIGEFNFCDKAKQLLQTLGKESARLGREFSAQSNVRCFSEWFYIQSAIRK